MRAFVLTLVWGFWLWQICCVGIISSSATALSTKKDCWKYWHLFQHFAKGYFSKTPLEFLVLGISERECVFNTLTFCFTFFRKNADSYCKHLCIILYYLYLMYCVIILLNALIDEKLGDKENATTAINHIWIVKVQSGLYWTAIVHRNLSSKQSSLWPSHRASRPTTWYLNNAHLGFVATAFD